MKINLSYPLGISMGSALACLFNPDSQAIQLFNTISSILIIVYLMQNSKESK